MISKQLIPKIFTVFKEGYSSKQFIRDLLSGLIVGIVALPLAIAFAIASGVKPEQGLYTAVVAGVVIAILGGSRAQVSGPTGAFIVIISGIVSQYGYEGLAVATFMAGLMLIAMGLLGFGVLLKFVPYPLTVGFTSGIALIIFSSQVNDFLGLGIQNLPAEFIPKWGSIISGIGKINYYSFFIGILSLGLIVASTKISKQVPGSLVAIIIATLTVSIFHLPVETIGSRYGSVPNSLPMPRFLDFSFDRINELFRPALTIALLGGIESLLSAVVADGMLGTRHRSNMELVAQGVGNVVSPLFQGIPATGAIARTATNIKNGGRTPVSAIFHSIVLLSIMYFFGGYAAYIPLSALSAVLIYVAYNMSEWHAFVRGLKYPKSDVLVLITTFLLTVLVDLTVAIEIGAVLAAFLFVKRMEETAGVTAISQQFMEEAKLSKAIDDTRDFSRADIPPGVEVFEAFGPIFFSAVDRFTNSLARLERKPKALILYITKVAVIDGSGLRALQSIKEKLERDNCKFVIAGASGQPLEAITRSEVIQDEFLLPTLGEALKFASSLK